jgi:hypothetical protein
MWVSNEHRVSRTVRPVRKKGPVDKFPLKYVYSVGVRLFDCIWLQSRHRARGTGNTTHPKIDQHIFSIHLDGLNSIIHTESSNIFGDEPLLTEPLNDTRLPRPTGTHGNDLDSRRSQHHRRSCVIATDPRLTRVRIECDSLGSPVLENRQGSL